MGLDISIAVLRLAYSIELEVHFASCSLRTVTVTLNSAQMLSSCGREIASWVLWLREFWLSLNRFGFPIHFDREARRRSEVRFVRIRDVTGGRLWFAGCLRKASGLIVSRAIYQISTSSTRVMGIDSILFRQCHSNP